MERVVSRGAGASAVAGVVSVAGVAQVAAHDRRGSDEVDADDGHRDPHDLERDGKSVAVEVLVVNYLHLKAQGFRSEVPPLGSGFRASADERSR